VAQLADALISGDVSYDRFLTMLLVKSPWIFREYLQRSDS